MEKGESFLDWAHKSSHHTCLERQQKMYLIFSLDQISLPRPRLGWLLRNDIDEYLWAGADTRYNTSWSSQTSGIVRGSPNYPKYSWFYLKKIAALELVWKSPYYPWQTLSELRWWSIGEYWALIGQFRSRDKNTGLWLAVMINSLDTGHWRGSLPLDNH